MKINRRQLVITASLLVLLSLSGAVSLLRADSGTCNGASLTLPFTDVAGNQFFCQIAAAYFSGLMSGTSGTTFTPGSNVPREQMAALITRTLDQSLKRGSRRAALGQLYTPESLSDGGVTSVGDYPKAVAYDGKDLWVTNYNSGTVSRVRASDGKLLETWTDAERATGVVVARGKIYIAGNTTLGSLYEIDPTKPAGSVTIDFQTLGIRPVAIAYDGSRIWMANEGEGLAPSGVSIVSFENGLSATTVSTGFQFLSGITYDGANIWVTDIGDHRLKKLDASGNILQTVEVGGQPYPPVFDGQNIWVPNDTSNSVTVVRASTGAVVATLTGNGLNQPTGAAFDGERILITNSFEPNVSLWKAADLSPLGFSGGGTVKGNAVGACSDGLNFWVVLSGANKLVRF